MVHVLRFFHFVHFLVGVAWLSLVGNLGLVSISQMFWKKKLRVNFQCHVDGEATTLPGYQAFVLTKKINKHVFQITCLMPIASPSWMKINKKRIILSSLIV